MDDLRHVMPFLLVAIAIVMGMAMAVVALMLDFRKKSQFLEFHHKERLLALEKGIELPALPPEFFESSSGRRMRAPADPLHRGVLLVLVGAAASFALLLNTSFAIATWGGVPIAAGLAYLAMALIERRATRLRPPPKSDAAA